MAIEDKEITKEMYEEFIQSFYEYCPSHRAIKIVVDYLPLDKLKQAVQNREIRVYNFRGQNYLDRLDIGRVYHKEPEKKEGLTIDRYFTDGKINPFDTTEYDQKNVEIKDVEGNIIFEMNNAVFPKSWDSTSASIVAQKYFYKPDKPEWKQRLKDRIGSEYENSIEHLITRVTNYFVEWGGKLGYFRTEEDKKAFAENPSKEVKRLYTEGLRRERCWYDDKARYQSMGEALRILCKISSSRV